MANNLKISDLPVASHINDDALVVLVQDHANKVVTVNELSNKINEVQNRTIDQLWHELRRVTGADTLKSVVNSVTNHEYRIDGIERLNGKQDQQLVNLTDALQTQSAKLAQHSSEIRLLQTATTENRRSLAYLNCRVDAICDDSVAYFSQISYIKDGLINLSKKHEEDLAYTYQYIADVQNSCYTYASSYIDAGVMDAYSYTSYEVDNNWSYTYSSYAYMSKFVHFGPQEYWGKIDELSDVYGNFDDNSGNNNGNTGTDTSNECVPGCGC